MSAYPMRSWLYVPGDDPRKHRRAATSDADVVILDLEDAVADRRKSEGREAVASALAELDFGRSRRFVRVNAHGTPHWRADLEAVLPRRPDGLVLAKASSAAGIRAVAAVARDAVGVLAPILTEDAAGALAVPETVVADPLIGAVMWGSEDLSASLGAWAAKDESGELLDVFRVVRSLVLLHAARHGLPAIDTPFLGLRDLDGLRAEAGAAARMGFAGKQAIHPDHVPVLNAAFVPPPAAVAEARELIAAFERDEAAVVRVAGAMADSPHLLRARHVVALAEAVGA